MRKGLAAGMLALAVVGATAAPRWFVHEVDGWLPRWAFVLAARAAGNQARAAAPAPPASPATVASPIPRNGAMPLSPPVDLAISGDIVGLPANAAATAVVHVGGRTFGAVVSGGRYSATVNALSDDDMVVVDVTSTRVHYRAGVGSFRSLKRHSRGDRKVDAGEHPALQVSPFGTAVQWLVRVALGGRDARSDDEYERATRAITSIDDGGTGAMRTMASRIASAMEKIATGSATLPAGFKDGLALVQDRAALKQFMATAGIGGADDAYPFSHASPAPLKSLSEVPATLLLTSAWIPGPAPSYASSLDILATDGTGRYSLHRQAQHPPAAPHATATFRGTINAAGDLVLDALNEAGSESTSIDHRSKTWTRRVVLRRMATGDRDSLWASEETVATTNLDQPSQAPSTTTTIALRTGFDLDRSSRADGWATLAPGDYTLAWPCAVPFVDPLYGERQLLDGCEHARYLFSSNGTGSLDDFGPKVDDRMQPVAGVPGPAFTWKLAAGGRLEVASAEATTWYWNIDAGDGVAPVVVYLARGKGEKTLGQSVAGLGRELRGTPLQASFAQMVGGWATSNSDEVAPARYPEAGARLVVQRASDGRSQSYTRAAGTAGEPYPGIWTVAGGRVVETRYMAELDGALLWVQDCAQALPPGASACWPAMVRTFRPLLREGTKLYGLADVYQAFDPKPVGYTGAYQSERVSSSLETFDCFEGACLGGTAGMAPQRVPASPRFPGPRPRLQGGNARAGGIRR